MLCTVRPLSVIHSAAPDRGKLVTRGRWGQCAPVAHRRCSEDTVHAFVTSRIDYCDSVIHDSSAVHIRSLQNALNVAARVVLHKRKFDHITADVWDCLHWLPVQQRVEYKVSLLIYKCLHQAAPSYLAEMCVPVSATDNRCSLRSATHGHLAVLRIRLARYRRRSFSVSGPLLWNSLPLTVRV